MNKKKYLFVDLDGSLIKSDLLYESFARFFNKDFLAPIKCFFIFLKGGTVYLKHFLAKNSSIEIANLPFNQKVLDFISNWKESNNGEIILISASNHSFVENISTHLGIFDKSYGTEKANLKSVVKLDLIQKHTNGEPFDYIGNSRDDLIIWKSCETPILVNSSIYINNKVTLFQKDPVYIQNRSNLLKEALKLMRVHQWSKNILLFLPIILAASFSQEILINTFLGFTAFSLLASSFYIFNDLMDIENDRNHSSKKNRPLASGNFSITNSIILSSVCLFFAALIALQLNTSFQSILTFYAIANFTYSKFLKKIPVVDIITLACLYLVRIIGGATISNVELSNWLITFSVFFFLFLATVKRWIEIEKSSSLLFFSRGYVKEDISFLENLSYFCGLISVLIICLYIDSQQAALIYSNSKFLWFIPLVFLYWIVETLFLATRKEVDDDPVVYALKSKTSYFCLIFLTIIFYLAL
ncbi:UbiA family prenyltransferase [Gammaproteobacteria bacterium]|nr:UbiA family prenyltransferase [Gammaproteobacteria bacterium]